MSLFKDILKQDLEKCFLNTDEFAEVITLAGRELPALVTSLEMEWPESDTDTRPVSYERLELHVSLEAFPDKLWQGKTLILNEETWFVETSDRADIRCIRLYRERGHC